MNDQAKARIAEIQNELRDLMARVTEIASKDACALRRAVSWLGDITNPLCDAEIDAWLSIEDETCTNYDETDVNQLLTDNDRRVATTYFTGNDLE